VLDAALVGFQGKPRLVLGAQHPSVALTVVRYSNSDLASLHRVASSPSNEQPPAPPVSPPVRAVLQSLLAAASLDAPLIRAGVAPACTALTLMSASAPPVSASPVEIEIIVPGVE